MAVDPVDDLVFVSTPGNGGVEVLDFSGNIVDTINGFGLSPSDEANSIVFADGSIYMTDTTNGTVDRIDPSTMSVQVLTSGLVTPSTTPSFPRMDPNSYRLVAPPTSSTVHIGDIVGAVPTS
jgi:hypothetical protein